MADWYLKHGDKEYGPMDSNKLRQLAAQNKIRPTDYIRRGADGKWTLASHAKGLFNDAAANDPSAPTPINVHSGDANSGAPLPVPPVAPTSNPAFSQTPNIQTPVAPPIATAIPVAQKAASSTSSSMSFGDGLEFSNNSAAPSSPKKGKKGKKKSDKKTVLIASIAGGSVLVLILVIILIMALSGKKENNVPTTDQTTTTQTDKDAEKPSEEENDPSKSENGEEAPSEKDEQNPDDANAQDGQPAEQTDIPENVFDSATQSGKDKDGDIEIKVQSVIQGSKTYIKKDGSEVECPEDATVISLSVQISNSEARIKFIPWSVLMSQGKAKNISLRDKKYSYEYMLKPGDLPKNVKKEPKMLYFGDAPVTDILIFDRFAPGAKELFLTLPVPDKPGETITFSIKTENVGKSTETAKPEAAAAEDAVQKESDLSASPQADPANDPNLEDDDDISMYREPSVEQQQEEEKRLEAELLKDRGF